MDSASLPSTSQPAPCNPDAHECAPVPQFRRLKYVYGQLLGVADFQTEQDYFREKLRLLNRCLHGYGVVCGLLVRPVSDPLDCAPSPAADPPASRVSIDCGVALDCNGDELIVRRPIVFDIWQQLSADDQRQLGTGSASVYVSLCFCEQPIDPVRPVLADQCGATTDCVYGKIREAVRVVVGLAQPKADERCETCCTACGEPCLPLARIDEFKRGQPVETAKIHNEIRRRLDPPYEPTVITGINWFHGAKYLKNNGEALLGTDDSTKGIVIEFSRPVHISSLKRGVIELWRIEGGRGRSGYLSEISGKFEDLDGLPASAMVKSLRYRQTDEENLDFGDRILIIVRCAFILDSCCRPVDGANVGGRVPPSSNAIDPGTAVDPLVDCVIPPWGYAPWTSGSGSPGSSFESWIVIAEHDDKKAAPGAGASPPKTGALP
jgi:hypothetical protein